MLRCVYAMLFILTATENSRRKVAALSMRITLFTVYICPHRIFCKNEALMIVAIALPVIRFYLFFVLLMYLSSLFIIFLACLSTSCLPNH